MRSRPPLPPAPRTAPGVAETTPGPRPDAGITADGGVFALVVVPQDRLDLGVPHCRPGLVTVSLRRPTTCVGTPAQLLDPLAQLAPSRWAAARASPQSLAAAAAKPPPRPSQARTTENCGVPTAGLPKLRTRLAWATGEHQGMLGVVVRAPARQATREPGREGRAACWEV